MTTSTAPAPTAGLRATPSPTVRFLLRNFVLYNPLFPFSAMLVLGAAWLLNPAQSDGGRAVPLLLQLLGVIGLYQVALLSAAGVLWRRGGLERDVRGLVLLLTPFLLDVTFTTSSLTVGLVSAGGSWGTVTLIGGILALTAIQLRIAAGLMGRRFDALAWLALLLGPALVLSVPALGAALALAGHADVIGVVVGFLLAGFVLLVGLVSGTEADDAGGRETLRRVAPLALVAALAHALMSAWTYQAPLLHVVGPVVIALGAVGPRLFPSLRPQAEFVGAALPLIGALLCGLPQVVGGGAPVGAWTLGLVALAGVHGVLFFKHQGFPFLAGVLGAALLSAGGSTMQTSFAAVGANPLEPFALAALFGFGLWRRSHPALLALPLLLGAKLTASLALFGSGLDVVLALDLIALGILAYTHREHGRSAEGASCRLVGSTLLYLPAALVAISPSVPHLHTAAMVMTGVALLGLGALALATRSRVYAWPTLLLPLQGAIEIAPSSTQAWGVLGLGAAFALVCGGVLVSLKRDQVLAWLSELDAAEAAAGQPVERVEPPEPHRVAA